VRGRVGRDHEELLECAFGTFSGVALKIIASAIMRIPRQATTNSEDLPPLAGS